jgi:hypothetical protein
MTTTEKQRRASHALGVLMAAENWLRRRTPNTPKASRLSSAMAALSGASAWLRTQALICGNKFKYAGRWFSLGALDAATLHGGLWHVLSLDGCDVQIDDAELYRWRAALAKAQKELR